jgi:hypothetical protein
MPFIANEASARRFVVDGVFDSASYHQWLKKVTAHPDTLQPPKQSLWATMKREWQDKGMHLGCMSLFFGVWIAGALSIALGLFGVPHFISLVFLTPVFTFLVVLYSAVRTQRRDLRKWEAARQDAMRTHLGTIAKGTVTRAELRILHQERYNYVEEHGEDHLVARLLVDYRFQAKALAHSAAYEHEINRQVIEDLPSSRQKRKRRLEDLERQWRARYKARVPEVGAPLYVVYLSEDNYALV